MYDDSIKDNNPERDKYILPVFLPNIEYNLTPTQPFYLSQLKEEIEILKRQMDYEKICKEIYYDMKLKKLL